MARILIADDDPIIPRILKDRLAKLGHDVIVAVDGEDALRLCDDVDVALLDLQMPKKDGIAVLTELNRAPSPPTCIVITAHGDVDKAVRAMRAGAYDFIAKPFEGGQIELVVARALERTRLRRDVRRLEQELVGRHELVRGPDPAMARVEALLDKIAPTGATVLITGETGTGKEVVARALHERSGRRGPFVAVNCAVLKGELLESELFGHEKGAFTGAVKARAGRVETAAGGTLFLDEIGELPLALQPKLLRVLQEREFERVGGDRTITADVRIVAATNRDLPAEIAAGQFREDLYYRVKVITVPLPPLRERSGDIPALAVALVVRHATAAGKRPPRISSTTMDVLRTWSWPGNVRELSNAIERAVLLGGDPLEPCDLPEEMLGTSAPSAAATEKIDDLFELPYVDAVARARRLIVVEALRRSGGHQTRAADALGVTQPYLSRLLKNLGAR